MNNKIIIIILMLFITTQITLSYNSMIKEGNHYINYEKGTDRTIYSQVTKFIPKDCYIRIDIVKRNNANYHGYAWYSGRIIIYDGNNMDIRTKVYVLEHEIGHLCSKNNRAGTYDQRETTADNYAKEHYQ